jgi:hypothetical protein
MPAEKRGPRSAANAWAQAAACAELAANASGPERRELFLRLRDSWIVIANDLQCFQATRYDKRIRMKRLRAYLGSNTH